MQMQTMETLLRNELLDSEELIWSGSPVKGGKSMSTRRFQVIGLMSIVFGLILMLVAILIEVLIGDLQTGRISFILLPGFGLFLAGVPLFVVGKVGNFAPKSTLYAITTRRVIIVDNSRSLRVLSFDKRAIHQVQRFEHRDGTGDLMFSSAVVFPSVYSNNSGNIGSQYVFEAIPDVHLAERKLLSAMG